MILPSGLTTRGAFVLVRTLKILLERRQLSSLCDTSSAINQAFEDYDAIILSQKSSLSKGAS